MLQVEWKRRLTADIRLRFAPPKLPSATSFIQKGYLKCVYLRQ